jgi:hypothetical protein
MMQLDRDQTTSVQTLTNKCLKFALLSLFSCCVCEHVVTSKIRIWQHWKVLDLLLQCSLLPVSVSVGSSMPIAYGYSMKFSILVQVLLSSQNLLSH